MMDRCKENVIEWIENEPIATFTFSQKKFVNRIRKMVANGEPCVTIEAENPDGSVTGHIRVKDIHLTVYKANQSAFAGSGEEVDS